MERFTLQSQLDAVLPQLARAHVELEDAEAQDPVRCRRAVTGRSGQPGPQGSPADAANERHDR
jgi:hypothetical protein